MPAFICHSKSILDQWDQEITSSKCERSAHRVRSLGDLCEELLVSARGANLVHQQLEARSRIPVTGQGIQHTTQFPYLLKFVAIEEQLLVTSRARIHIDRGIEAPLREPSVKAKLHVAGSLELLEDDLVHLGAGLHQCSGEDRQRPSLFDVAGRPEELLRWVEGTGVDPTGHDPAGGRLRQVVGASEPGDAVEE